MTAVLGSLDEFIEKGQLECLNADQAHPVTNAFEAGKEAVLASDESTDHQLLVKVQFRVPVKIQTLTILGNAEDETAPQTVKIFQDKVNMGFEEAEEETPIQEINLTAAELGGQCCQLRFVKFQSVTSLQLFIQDNFGAAQTKVHRIEFCGQPAQSMDMKDWKPIKG
eukprot:CAMPEP_0197619904 /NCGR_PEP_ID=MMETSP1338-20131121/860_1 /TAXON_ID=43686 ORGANISM="Pelagodinium beii, Strain RCC1491" /NCGR_SAMPLE_ID=MMETSP1338 /ASSEMBLY_ACC=CAM_ASM_000754 /LENGTH=166 /DNA_ID=CAMNT_0043188957 /DNA_START=73 /DNA_END=573 /DNA_ORIENTATION=+